MKTLIIIPAYNEAENLPRVIPALHNYPQFDYVVVNDGSKDDTVRLCKANGWNYLDLPVNMGLAAAIQTGMRYARLHGYDFAVQFDGDGQHRPEYISALLDAMTDADIAIGSRFIGSRKPGGMRMLGSNLIQLALRLTTGQNITDPTSGMRMYSRKMIRIIALGADYGPEPDTLAYLSRCGARIREVPVKMDERIAGESYLNMSRAVRYMVYMLMSIGVFQFVRGKITIK